MNAKCKGCGEEVVCKYQHAEAEYWHMSCLLKATEEVRENYLRKNMD